MPVRKTKRTPTGSKKRASKRVKKASPAKQVAKPSRPKNAPKKKQVKKKRASRTRASRGQKSRQALTQELEVSLGRQGVISGRQSGDLQGLSQAEQADSESVDELAEEGNLFEAGAVAGVEAADNADEREVHTHEVPEDDVPDEYLDQD